MWVYVSERGFKHLLTRCVSRKPHTLRQFYPLWGSVKGCLYITCLFAACATRQPGIASRLWQVGETLVAMALGGVLGVYDWRFMWVPMPLTDVMGWCSKHFFQGFPLDDQHLESEDQIRWFKNPPYGKGGCCEGRRCVSHHFYHGAAWRVKNFSIGGFLETIFCELHRGWTSKDPPHLPTKHDHETPRLDIARHIPVDQLIRGKWPPSNWRYVEDGKSTFLQWKNGPLVV